MKYFFPFLIEEDGIEHSLYGNVVLVCIEKKKNDIIGCNSVVLKKCIDVFLLKKKKEVNNACSCLRCFWCREAGCEAVNM